MSKVLTASPVNRISPWEFASILSLVLAVVGALFGLAQVVSFKSSSYGDQSRNTLANRGYAVFIHERCFYCHTGGSRRLEKNMRQLIWPVSYRRKVVLGWSQSAPDLVTEAGRRTDDWQLAHLLDPRAVAGGSAMPVFDYLSDKDTKAVIAFLQRERKLGPAIRRERVSAARIPTIRKTFKNYRAGRRIYSQYCVGCHGEYGNGSGRIGHVLNPEPRDFTNAAWMESRTNAYLFDKISNGKARTAMPVFANILTFRERALVLSYIRYFPDAAARQRMEEGLPERLRNKR